MSEVEPPRRPYRPPRLEPLGPWTLRLGVELSFPTTVPPVFVPTDDEGVF